MKRSLIALAAVLILTLGLTASAQAGFDSVKSDIFENKVKITGIYTGGGGKLVTLMVLNPGKTAADAKDTQAVRSLGMMRTKEDGSFGFNVPFGDAGEGNYTVILGAEEEGAREEFTLYYISTEQQQTILQELNGAPETEIMGVIERYNNYLLLETGEGSVYSALKQQDFVAKYLCRQTFTEKAQVQDAFADAVAMQALNESISAAGSVARLALGAPAAQQETYQAMVDSSDEYLAFFHRSLSGKAYQETADFTARFADALTVMKINKADYAQIGTVLQELGFDGRSGYAGLSQQKQTNVQKQIVLADHFESIAAFTSYFDSACAAQNTGGGSGGSGGGGRGPSGGGSTATVPQDMTEPNPLPPVEQPLFHDMDSSHWAYQDVKALKEKNLVQGNENGDFEPDRAITREEFVAMAARAFGLTGEAEALPFEDVEEGAWYAPYIAAAYQSGVVQGDSDKRFGVGNSLTREDMAVICFRLMNVPEGGELKFDDTQEISQYARGAVAAMQKAGVIQGVDETTFAPGASATRAQVAAVISRILAAGGVQE